MTRVATAAIAQPLAIQSSEVPSLLPQSRVGVNVSTRGRYRVGQSGACWKRLNRAGESIQSPFAPAEQRQLLLVMLLDAGAVAHAH